ncbi:MAG: hypothetical protein KME06_05960 [Kastovskya adunca ATA6-11-RM4]|nr:hypothetical protein [Kastovskya adunca ATA6-11-RM4]
MVAPHTNKLGAHGDTTVALFCHPDRKNTYRPIYLPPVMSDQNHQELIDRVIELETKFTASLDAIAHLLKAVDHLRANDTQGVFDLDLARHALNEAGYQEIDPATDPQNWQS